jgi:predicted glycoside hydrolase/deacetylase ChbG (UPF0249 family)
MEAEITAQAEMFEKLMGRPPAYVDCHHHAHQLPTIRQALANVISSGKLPAMTRITVEAPETLANVSTRKAHRWAARFIGQRAKKLFEQHNIHCNDYFFGMLSPNDWSKPFAWSEYLNHLPKTGIVEWVVHPGLEDETLAGRDEYGAMRVRELQALTDEQYWAALRPYLTRKSDLWKDKPNS